MPRDRGRISKVRRQLASLATVIDVWRQEVHNQIVLTPMWANWVEAYLLPLMYWQHQVSCTPGRQRKAQLVKAFGVQRRSRVAVPSRCAMDPKLVWNGSMP